MSLSTSTLSALADQAVAAFIRDNQTIVDVAQWHATTSNQGDQTTLALGVIRGLVSVQVSHIREGVDVTSTHFQTLQSAVRAAEAIIQARRYTPAELDHFRAEWMTAQDDRDAGVRLERTRAAEALNRAISRAL